MKHGEKFLKNILRRNNPLYNKVGELVVSFTESGDYVWSNPSFNQQRAAICLEYRSTKGKVFYVEASRIFDQTHILDDQQADFVWKEGVVPYPLVDNDEDWERVSWAYLEKHKRHWKKVNENSKRQ